MQAIGRQPQRTPDGAPVHYERHRPEQAADERQALEQLCRTITRPALANERVQINSAGQVVLRLKTPWRDGTTHIAPVAAGVHACWRRPKNEPLMRVVPTQN